MEAIAFVASVKYQACIVWELWMAHARFPELQTQPDSAESSLKIKSIVPFSNEHNLKISMIMETFKYLPDFKMQMLAAHQGSILQRTKDRRTFWLALNLCNETSLNSL